MKKTARKKSAGKKVARKLEGVTLGERIRNLRGNMAQAEFADILGIKQPMISRYEADKESPSPRVLLRMAQYSGTSIEWLLTGEELLKVKSGPLRKKPRGKMSTRGLLNLAAEEVQRTALPESEEFAEMVQDLSRDRRRIRKILEYYRFLKVGE
jgi:transcriptional regulator with XRE-family HTH domain